eukprot:TRINITY_DN91621_c0_g1_i1.p1 TRINITY_DN91621_c0_g1~~TRINITY_DN91621_c0_g1_i1.p1  ORF type:complete len:389 (+),score=77.90 TRINITY_DN91621_c0_g1_i1:212-1378(+)
MFRVLIDGYYRLRRLLPSWEPSTQVILLGKSYDCSQADAKRAFSEDFRSRLQFTYRKALSEPVQLGSHGGVVTSDSGWGCMLRTIQMMLGQAFLLTLSGRDWQFDEERDLAPDSLYLQVVSCFLDVSSASFSLQRFVRSGQQRLGKPPSTWFGPTSAAQMAGHLLNEAAAAVASSTCEAAQGDAGAEKTSAGGCPPKFLQQLACVVFDEGVIYKAEVLNCFEQGQTTPVDAIVLLICGRWGLDQFNVEQYKEGMKACFLMPEFLGLASGNDGSSAHYFVATHGEDQLLYLDPHVTFPALEAIEEVSAGSECADTLRPPGPQALAWSRLNPSVCLGFLVRSKDEFLKLCDSLEEGRKGDVFEVMEKRPCYDQHALLQEDEEDGELLVYG